MSRRLEAAVSLALALAMTGCSIKPTTVVPRYAASDELVLTYDGRYTLSAHGQVVARGYDYGGLTDYVRCVPEAEQHAREAESNGSIAVPLQTAGIVTSVAGVGGLSGLAFINKDGNTAAGLILGGLAVQAVGLLLVGLGAQAKVSANGHAVDAMSYYNDAVGSHGYRCTPPAAPTEP
jgi:hypothetical protein